MMPEAGTEDDSQNRDGENGEPTLVSARSWSTRLKIIAALVVIASVSAITAKVVDWVFTDHSKYSYNVDTNRDAIDKKRDFPGGTYLAKDGMQRVPSPPTGDSCAGRYLWAQAFQAADVGSTLVRLNVTAKQDHNVQITDIRLDEPTKETLSPSATVLDCPGGGGNEAVSAAFVDLDAGTVRYFNGTTKREVPLNVAVAPGATEAINVLATANQSSWSYRLKVDLIVDGKRITETIDKGGQPFLTIAGTNLKRYRWLNDRWTDTNSQPPTTTSPGSVDPCSLLSVADVAKALPRATSRRTDPQSTTGTAGAPITASMCVFTDGRGSVVQVNLTDTRSDDEARREYEQQVLLAFRDQQPKVLGGYRGPANQVGSRVMILHGRTVLDVIITRFNGRAQPGDEALATSLSRQADQRLP